MKKTASQVNFTAGILTPYLHGHVDLTKYKNGVKDAINVNVLPHGPLQKRRGLKYINAVKTPAKKTNLLKFQFDLTNAYILEFGHNYIRFIKDGAVLGAPYEVTTTYTEDEVFALSVVQFGNTLYIAHPNHPIATLTWTSDTSWLLEDLFFYPPPTAEDGYSPAGLTIQPASTTGTNVNFSASGAVFLDGDVGREIINLVGRGRASIKSKTSTTVVVCDIIEDFPNTSAIAAGDWKLSGTPVSKLTIDTTVLGATATIKSYYTDSALGSSKAITNITQANPGVVTSNGHGFANGDKVLITNVLGMTQVNKRYWTVKATAANTFALGNDENANFDTTNYTAYTSGGIARKKLQDIGLDVFRAADVGRFIKINNGIAEITAVTDAQTITVQIQKSLNSASDSSIWTLESESWTSTKGYPRALALHQGRLFAASTDTDLQTVWASEPGIFDSIAIGSGDGDGLQFDVATKEVNQINWMIGIRDSLILGTSSSELSIDSTSSDGAITASAKEKPRGYAGSDVQIPVPINNEVLFIQRGGYRINAFYYDFSIDNYKPDDLMFLAEHLSTSGVKQITYADSPFGQIFAVMNDGTMCVGTYMREQQVIGWTKATTDGEFEAVNSISTNNTDEVYVVVKRTINGSNTRYIERFDFIDPEDPIAGFSDSYLTYSNPKTITTITKANPAVVTTSGAHGYSNGDFVKILHAEGMTEINGITYKVANQAGTTFELTDTSGNNINSTSYGTYTDSGEAHKLVTTISGLSHLEGETVQVKTDGAVHPDAIVSSGAITLQQRAAEVTVGLAYEASITLLPLEYTLDGGSQQGQPIRWVTPILRLYQSALPLLNDGFLPARNPTDLTDAAVPLFTGDAVYGPQTWEASMNLNISSSLPLPLTVLGIFGTIDGGMK